MLIARNKAIERSHFPMTNGGWWASMLAKYFRWKWAFERSAKVAHSSESKNGKFEEYNLFKSLNLTCWFRVYSNKSKHCLWFEFIKYVCVGLILYTFVFILKEIQYWIEKSKYFLLHRMKMPLAVFFSFVYLCPTTVLIHWNCTSSIVWKHFGNTVEKGWKIQFP